VINTNESKIQEIEKKINVKNNLLTNLQSLTMDDFIARYREGDFTFIIHEFERRSISSLYLAIKDIIKNEDDHLKLLHDFMSCDKFDLYNNKNPHNSKLIELISRFPEVEACGHTGNTFMWTFHNVRRIYKDGYKSYVRTYFNNILDESY